MRVSGRNLGLLLFVRVVLIVPIVFGALAPAVARAQENSEGHAFYAGAAFAIGFEQFDLEGGFSNHKEATGVDLWAGYRATRKISIEAEFVYLAGFDSSLGTKSVQFNALNFTANLKFYPMTGSVRPYLVSGVGGGRFEIESGTFKGHAKGGVFRFGGGAELNFGTPVDFVVGVDYLLTSGLGGSDLLQIKLGFQHPF